MQLLVVFLEIRTTSSCFARPLVDNVQTLIVCGSDLTQVGVVYRFDLTSSDGKQNFWLVDLKVRSCIFSLTFGPGPAGYCCGCVLFLTFLLCTPVSLFALDIIVHDCLQNGAGAVKECAADTKADCMLVMKEADFVLLMTGKLNAQQAFMKGQLKIKGNMMLAQKLDVLVKAKPAL